MKHNLFKAVLLILGIALISSCVPKKRLLYLQDIDTSLTDNELNYQSIIKKDDILRISVTSENMELVQPFNQLIGITNQSSLNGIGQQGQLFGYLVDNHGTLVFPLLGTIEAAGKTREEMTVFLQSKIREGFVKDAVVDVRIVNFKVTVLGEVNRPGTFNLDYNRITLLQVLGQAGDLTIYGNRKNITILRDVDGVQTSHRVDLTTSDFIDSDFYYLQQNDVVVVEPNYAQVQAAGFNRNASLYVSIASILLSLIVIISRN
ncbi:polysaccharide biosynthesis/export family protein [Nonlabens sp.]|uniref:polysaccharide biosynthesis/export family protein n=1 Tax=Nonlabens sp. TaxID=1888209 RepID=UPI00260FDA6F|nr:polysaccharide biosynthesis/export family protein [Nonlabens sp.]